MPGIDLGNFAQVFQHLESLEIADGISSGRLFNARFVSGETLSEEVYAFIKIFVPCQSERSFLSLIEVGDLLVTIKNQKRENMHTRTNKTKENKVLSVAVAQKQNSQNSTARDSSVYHAQEKPQDMVDSSPQVRQLRSFQEMANNSQRARQAAQMKELSDTYATRQQNAHIIQLISLDEEWEKNQQDILPATPGTSAADVVAPVADTTAVLGDLAATGVSGPQSLVEANFMQAPGVQVENPASMGIDAAANGQAQYTTNTTNETKIAGPTLAAAGVVLNVAGLGMAGKRLHEARSEHNDLRKNGLTEGPQIHAAHRDVRSAGADVGEKTAGVVGSTATLTSAALLTAANNASHGAGALYHASAGASAAGGLVTAPLSGIQSIRLARKAYLANQRVNRLYAVILTKPPKTLEEIWDNSAQRLSALQEQKEALKELDDQQGLQKNQREIEQTQDELDLAPQFHGSAVQVLHESAAATHQDQPPSLDEIRAYAIKKNERGVLKKVIGSYAALVGAAAGVASTVAAIALAAGAVSGAAVLMATPVGWALAGAAALIGLTLFSINLVRGWKKRFKQQAKFDKQGNYNSFGKRLRKSMRFWKKPPGKRDLYAARLVDLAWDDDATTRYDARQILFALVGEKKHKSSVPDYDKPFSSAERKALVKIVTAKMAS